MTHLGEDMLVIDQEVIFKGNILRGCWIFWGATTQLQPNNMSKLGIGCPPHLPNYLFEVKKHATTTRNKSIPKIIPTPSNYMVNYILYILTSGVLCFFGWVHAMFGGGRCLESLESRCFWIPKCGGSLHSIAWLPLRRSSWDWQNVVFFSPPPSPLLGWN